GTTHRVGDKITADDIIAPDWRGADDPATLAAHCLATVAPAVAEQVREGDMLLAGRDFGAGAEPEGAVLALQGAGFAAVVCESADSGFVLTAEGYGLPVLISPTAVVALTAGGG